MLPAARRHVRGRETGRAACTPAYGVNLQELKRYRYSRRSVVPWLSHGAISFLFDKYSLLMSSESVCSLYPTRLSQKLDAPPAFRWCTSQGNIRVNTHTADPHETETSVSNIADRSTEIADQHWDRTKSVALAQSEGIALNDEHWAVIEFLREYCPEHGLSINARTTGRATTTTCAGSSTTDRLRKAAGSAICVPPRTPSIPRSAPATQAGGWLAPTDATPRASGQ